MIKNSLKKYLKLWALFFVSILIFDASAQRLQKKLPQKKSSETLSPKKEIVAESTNTSMIYLENSDILLFDKDRLPDVQVLVGNVCFRHDDIYLYCDSAYFYESKNSLDAFSNVKIIQGDTLFVYGDVGYYDGNTRMARLRKNVRMENKSALLTTDSLNYDRMRNVGYFFNGGQLEDSLNVLVSVFGYYYPATNTANFRKKVKLTNPKFVMHSDTLNYNTNTNVANILGPTHINYEEETHIYSERGWYDTKNELAELLDNSYVENQDTKRLIGDTIFYDKKKGLARAYRNIELADTLKKVLLFGNYGFYNELTEEGLATDSAMMIEYSGGDTLFLHADTLFTYADSVYKVVEAYHNVRFYRTDLQGIADSASYQTRDSTLQLMYSPIVWSDDQQIIGDTIRAYMKNGSLDKAHVIGAAFACQKKDSIHFNQMIGKEFWAFMQEGNLYKIESNGNAQSIFYPIDEADGSFIGLNTTQSSYLHTYFKDGKVDKVLIFPSPVATMYPMDQLTKEIMFFPNFVWKQEYRPMRKEDIFLRFDRKKDEVGNSSRKKRTSKSGTK